MKDLKIGSLVYYVPLNAKLYTRDFGIVTDIDLLTGEFELTSLQSGLREERCFPLSYIGRKIFLDKEKADQIYKLRYLE